MPAAIRPHSSWVDVDGPVHCWRWPGAAGATIVCIHGVGESHLAWAPVAPKLAEWGTVLAVDLPGFGDTPRLGRRCSVASAQRLVAGLIARCRDRHLVLMGSSFGGAVAARHAAADPQAVDGLVLSSSYLPPVLNLRSSIPTLARMVRIHRRGSGAETGDVDVLDMARQAAGTADLPVDDAGLRQQFLRHRHRARSSRRSTWEANLSLALWSMWPPHPRRTFNRITAPTVLVHGQEDGDVPVGWARAQHSRRPGWRLRVLDGEGHVARLDDLTEWLEPVTDLLEAVTNR